MASGSPLCCQALAGVSSCLCNGPFWCGLQSAVPNLAGVIQVPCAATAAAEHPLAMALHTDAVQEDIAARAVGSISRLDASLPQSCIAKGQAPPTMLPAPPPSC